MRIGVSRAVSLMFLLSAILAVALLAVTLLYFSTGRGEVTTTTFTSVNFTTLTSTTLATLTSTAFTTMTLVTTSTGFTTSTLTSLINESQNYIEVGNYTLAVPALASTPCNESVTSAPYWSFTLKANSDRPSLVCVAYFFYNSTAPFKIRTTNLIGVFGWPLHPTGPFTTFNATSNFTISASPAHLVLGGPTRMNEGVEVTYQIQAEPGVNGTFEAGVSGTLIPQEEGCSSDFLLSAGTGSPSYAGPDMCFLLPPGPSPSQPLPSGYLFTYLIGATNSTS